MKEYCIVVEVKERGRLEREDLSYVDYDEVAELLKGIDYISKIDRSVTSLSDFQADYRTSGDLMISTFSLSSAGGGIAAVIQSERVGSTSVIISMDALQQLRGLLEQAKVKLEVAQEHASS